MGKVRDPERDQQLPEDGQIGVQDELLRHVYMTGYSPELEGAMIRAVHERRSFGILKYGKPLQTHNGRDALVDAWEESADLVSYVLQFNLEEPEDGRQYLGTFFEQALELFAGLTRERLVRGDEL